MPSLSILVKPSSGNCNVRCRYCFYHDEQINRDTYSYGFMSEKTLETLIKKALSYADRECSFGFQGGEPTLSGLDFFRKVVEFQKKYNVHGTRIANAIQTNGLLIDDEWAEFLRQNHFLVGLSLDGNKQLHDLNRLDPAGKGTYARVFHAAQVLTAHKVDFNILTVVTGQTADAISKIYSFYRRSGLLYQQYIPCLDPLEEERGSSPYSLTPEKYGKFLKTLFDLWYRDLQAGKFIYIRYFENLLGMLLGGHPESCGMSGNCMIQNIVEADGSVYPCDFYCLDKWKLGNIRDDDFASMAENQTASAFLAEAKREMPDCKGCKWYFICRGGCRRDREPMEENAPVKNYFCSAYQEFFEYAMPRLQEVAANISRGHRYF